MNMPATAAQQVRRAVRRGVADLPKGQLVLVACSGGPDSLALARAAAALDRAVGVVIVDHQLQFGSAQTARQAAAQCQAFGIDLIEVIPVDVPGGPGHGGPEAAARDVRRRALQQVAARHGAGAVLLGHTRDDQAETVLLRLARGSGARSLAAMAPHDGLWRRPLLQVRRSVVHASVADLPVWQDPHNADARFTRSRVRSTVLPALAGSLGEGVISGLARSADLLRDDADALDDWAEQAWRQSAEIDDAATSFAIGDLAAYPRAIRTRLLRRAAVRAGASAMATSFDQVQRMESLISDWHGQGRLDLPGGVKVGRECGRLRVSPAQDSRESTREQ